MRWREHLYDMDYLREGIGLRGLAQVDPLIAYKNEGFELFQDLMNTIWSDFARMIFNVEVALEVDGRARAGRAGSGRGERSNWVGGGGLTYSSGSSTATALGALAGSDAAPVGARRRRSAGAARGRRRERRAAARRRDRPDRPQRPVLVRLGQEIQEVPRRHDAVHAPDARAGAASADSLRGVSTASAPSSEPTPQRLAAIRDQLKLLADYL